MEEISKEIVRDGYIVPKNLYDLWQVELEILDKVDYICKKHEIKYFLMYGTLIGAIRHKGFIPWDDDIDIMMTRENYDKFLNIAQAELGSEYFLQNTYTDKGLYRVHSQIRKIGTTMLLRGDYKRKYNRGVFFDIFVCDKVPLDNGTFLSVRNSIKLKNKLAYWGNLPFSFNPKSIIKKMIGSIYLICKGGNRRALKSLEATAQKYSKLTEYGYADIVFVNDGKIKIFDKECFENLEDLEFEGKYYPCPSAPLKVLYTEYDETVMTPQRQSTTHGGLYWDINNSYEVYDKLSKKDFLKLFESKY